MGNNSKIVRLVATWVCVMDALDYVLLAFGDDLSRTIVLPPQWAWLYALAALWMLTIAHDVWLGLSPYTAGKSAR
jgi:hypothetical protein